MNRNDLIISEPLEPRLLLADNPIVGINVKKPDAAETDPAAAGMGQFTVRRSGPIDTNLDVGVRVSPGASVALNGIDFEPLLKTIRIRKGRSYAHFNLIPIDDNLRERDEVVVVKIHPRPSMYAISTSRPADRLTIADNDTPPIVGIYAVKSDASEEDPTGSGAARFRVERTGFTTQPLLVRYDVREISTATSGADFEPLSGSITIPANQRSATFSLIPIDDEIVEPLEHVTLTLRASPSYIRGHHSAVISIADNEESSRPGWWNDAWEFRALVTVQAGASQHVDKVVERSINFTHLLAALGRTGTLVENSIRIVETSADGLDVLDDDVPFQFDKAGSYNASSNAGGTLVFLAQGTTQANVSRRYHVYFDTAGSFDTHSVDSLITTTDNIVDEGQSSVRIATQGGTYFYHKQGGGFSSLVDANGNDWISYNPSDSPASAGRFRGVPNTGDAFHPGYTDSLTTIISQGPLKTVLESTADNGLRRMRWEFFPTFARATMIENADPYWFLYEGTPGGAIDANDLVVRSDGTQTDITESWTDESGLGSQNGQEWVYFADSAVNRSFFLLHNDRDNLEDSYFNLDGNMTVFGFGRRNNAGAEATKLMTASQNTFTIGLIDTTAFAAASNLILSAGTDAILTLGAAQTRVAG